MMIKKILVLTELVNLLLAGGVYEDDPDPDDNAPYKEIETVDINAPKQDSVVSKIDASLSYEEIAFLNDFLTQKVENVNEIKEKNSRSGKTSLPSLSSVWDIANYLVGTGGS